MLFFENISLYKHPGNKDSIFVTYFKNVVSLLVDGFEYVLIWGVFEKKILFFYLVAPYKMLHFKIEIDIHGCHNVLWNFIVVLLIRLFLLCKPIVSKMNTVGNVSFKFLAACFRTWL